MTPRPKQRRFIPRLMSAMAVALGAMAPRDPFHSGTRQRHKRGKQREHGPGSFATIHMLRRAVAKGFVYAPSPRTSSSGKVKRKRSHFDFMFGKAL